MNHYTPMPERRMAKPKSYPVCSFKKVLDIINSKCGNAYISERHGKGDNKLIILPDAAQEHEVITSYGRRTPMNAKEQKYVGYGHFLKDENGNTITIVKHFIEIQTMNRNAVGASNLGPNGEYNPGLDFLEYHREEFLRNERKYNTDAFGGQVDPFMELCGPSEFVLEGHTHPDLSVFYSRTDRVSGSARAATSPVCIFVCDPIRKQMLGSTGKDFAATEVIVYSHSKNIPGLIGNKKLLIPPTNEIVRLCEQCLNTGVFKGKIRLNTRLDGKNLLNIKLIIPKGVNSRDKSS